MRSRAVAVLKPLTWGRGSGILTGLRLAPHLAQMILENLVSGPSTRLAAGTLALPLAVAAGCGVEKRRTVKAEFASAQGNLAKSKAVSFTIRLDDSKGSIRALATKDKSAPKGFVDAALPGSVTLTVDPASNATLASLGAGACSGKMTTDLTAAIKKVNVALVVRDAHAAVAELRLVGGVLHAHVDLTEIAAVAKDSGVKDFDAKLDEAIRSADPAFARGLADVKAGQWISVPLATYRTKFQDLAKGFSGLGAGGATDARSAPSDAPTGTADCKAVSKVGTDVFAAIKSYVKVTDAGDSSSDRVLDIKVKARPALKAALSMLQVDKGLLFASLLKSVEPTAVDDAIADGTITLRSGHLTQATIDLESVGTLATDPGKDSFAGSSIVLDVNDKAAEVAAPGNVLTFDVGALIDNFLSGMTGNGLESSSTDVVG